LAAPRERPTFGVISRSFVLRFPDRARRSPLSALSLDDRRRRRSVSQPAKVTRLDLQKSNSLIRETVYSRAVYSLAYFHPLCQGACIEKLAVSMHILFSKSARRSCLYKLAVSNGNGRIFAPGLKSHCLDLFI
jgi:hypothetical protein